MPCHSMALVRCVRRLMLLAGFWTPAALASPVALGVLSYNELLPGAPGEGVNYFSLLNLTGDPSAGG